MTRAALYARVSTRRQVQDATIESQIAQLEDYAAAHGYQVAAEDYYLDQAVSGQQLARPGLDRLRDAALLASFQVVLCLSPDRLARNLGAQQVVLAELRRLGVTVIFVTQPPGADSPQQALLLAIQGAFAEYERVLIHERLRRGRLYRLRQGQSVPVQAPYGYRFQSTGRPGRSQWVVVAAEAAIVTALFTTYTSRTISVGELARDLNRRAVPSPGGTQWQATTVGRLLRQRAYTGTVSTNRHQTDRSVIGQPRRQGRGRLRCPRYRLRPVEEWIAVAVPPLIAESLWQAAQERLDMQTRFARRNSQQRYLLRGLLVCATCGHTLQGRTQKQVVRYVCTHGASHRPPAVPPHTCTIRAEQVEPLIWQALSALLRDPARIRQAWEQLQGDQTPAARPTWHRRHTTLTAQRQRLLDAYQAGLLPLDDLTARLNPLDLELQQLAQQLAHTAQPIQHPDLPTFTAHIQRALDACDFDTQQEVLRLLIERVVVAPDALTIEHIVPLTDQSRLHDTCRDA